MDASDKLFREALENCSRAPIHIPGAIQDFGALIGTDPGFNRIRYASANTGALLGTDAEKLLGENTSCLFGADEIEAVGDALRNSFVRTQREVLPGKEIDGQVFQVSVHLRADTAILELIPETAHAEDRHLALDRAQALLSTHLETTDLAEFFQDAVHRVRAINGYDRVMFYKFLPDGAGEVIAEVSAPGLPAFRGLRFPASDIPDIARKLYATTPIRALFDVDGADVPLIAEAGLEPLDMSLSVLRGKDVVHSKYLQNMGVRSTQTIPVVVNGVLWGLFASHHMAVKRPDPAALRACELAGKLVSLRVSNVLNERQDRYVAACSAVARKLIVADDSELAIASYWQKMRDQVRGLVPADGVMLVMGGQCHTWGQCPDAVACEAVAKIDPDSPDGVTALDSLRPRFPDLSFGETAGALIVAASGVGDVRVVFFRALASSTIARAGKDEKEIGIGPDGPVLSPRNSFETYIDLVRDSCQPWLDEDIAVGRALQEAISQTLVAQAEQRENRHRLGLMVRELNHRVRNILSVVTSLSRHSRDSAQSASEYADVLEQRILALSKANDLLTQSGMTGASLEDILRVELQGFSGSSAKIRIDGPIAILRPETTSVMALLFHELTSNAAKHGALASADGRLDVIWAPSQGGIEVRWQERGGPAVTPPRRSGFGQVIIRDAVPYEFKGEAEWRCEPEGVSARFWLPGEVFRAGSDLPGPDLPAIAPQSTPETGPFAFGGPASALVLEDDFIIALGLQAGLLEEGFDEVRIAANQHDALEALSADAFRFCMLDVKLQGETSAKVAEHLEKSGIPFVFSTGYGADGGDLAGRFDAPVLAKPVRQEDLRAALHLLFPDITP